MSSPLSNPLPCFCCGKALAPAMRGVRLKASGQPSDAVMCSTYGNYGSTVFDPNGVAAAYSDKLYFNICDSCLVSNRDRVMHVREIRQSPELEYLTGGRHWTAGLSEEIFKADVSSGCRTGDPAPNHHYVYLESHYALEAGGPHDPDKVTCACPIGVDHNDVA